MTRKEWTDAEIRDAFIDDGGLSDYHDPVNGWREQKRIAGAIFDEWLAGKLTKVWDEGYVAGASFADGLGDYVAPQANPYGKTAIRGMI